MLDGSLTSFSPKLDSRYEKRNNTEHMTDSTNLKYKTVCSWTVLDFDWNYSLSQKQLEFRQHLYEFIQLDMIIKTGRSYQ